MYEPVLCYIMLIAIVYWPSGKRCTRADMCRSYDNSAYFCFVLFHLLFLYSTSAVLVKIFINSRRMFYTGLRFIVQEVIGVTV